MVFGEAADRQLSDLPVVLDDETNEGVDIALDALRRARLSGTLWGEDDDINGDLASEGCPMCGLELRSNLLPGLRQQLLLTSALSSVVALSQQFRSLDSEVK